MRADRLCAILYYDESQDIGLKKSSTIDEIGSVDEFELIVEEYKNLKDFGFVPTLKWAKLFDSVGNEVIFWNGKEFLGGH